ncbi:glycosyltransferase family 2 protein [Patescibacteria group bacterium]|nr:glycosyltransferase family 2 protein [Patescibacteria group bacterium]
MKASVIIPTYNEEKVIANCLKSLLGQTLEDFEIIVVDDGSFDKTKQVLRNFQFPPRSGLLVSNFQLLEQKHRGPGMARNLGAKHSIGEILVFVDADMTFDKNFLRNLIKPIIAGKANGTFSKYEYVSNWENVWARCWNINQGWEEKRRHPRSYPDTQLVFRAILKKEFDRVGGFDPKLGYMDDWTLSQKLGYGALAADGAIFYHENPGTLEEVFPQAKWIGKRPYKLGAVGDIIALVRASLPMSLAVGLVRSLISQNPAFLVFKIVYDFGIFVGILERLFLGKLVK